MGTQKNRLLSTYSIVLVDKIRILEKNAPYLELCAQASQIWQGIRCGRVVSVGDFETGCPGFDPQ